jgi:hypothetical protein
LRHEDGLFYLAGNNSLEADDILFVMRCIAEGKNVFNYDPEACVYACELPLFLPSLLELVATFLSTRRFLHLQFTCAYISPCNNPALMENATQMVQK